MSRNRLVVSEIFGPTFQGEGPSTGKYAHFLRLGGCNLKCVWCDTPYTWDWSIYDPKKELEKLSADEIYTRLRDLGFNDNLLVITGGEPLLQAEQLYHFIGDLPLHGYIEIETAGTVEPLGHEQFVSYNVSPKLANSGNAFDKRRKLDILETFAFDYGANFKFVVKNKDDFREIDEIVNTIGISEPQVWIMPEGTSADKILAGLRNLEEPVLARGWNLTSRNHVLMHGDKRGV